MNFERQHTESGSSPPDLPERAEVNRPVESELRALRPRGKVMNGAAVETFSRLMADVPGLRARITVDSEGWPLVRGRHGRLEWHGEPEAGQESCSPRIYAYTDRKRILFKLSAVPGVRPCQTGDDEGTVSVLATDHGAVLACARLLRCHTNGRGVHSAGRSAKGMASMRMSQLRTVTAATLSTC